jgi:hypothetical protein
MDAELNCHPAKPVRDPSQVPSQISATIDGLNQFFTLYYHSRSPNGVDNPTWKVHHSMQNLIPNPSEPVRDPSQTPSQISPAIHM